MALLFPPRESDRIDSKEECEPLYNNSITEKTGNNKLDRNAAMSYIIETNAQAYKNPVFLEDDAKNGP